MRKGKTMGPIVKMLNGKKTYLIVAAGVVLGILQSYGVLTLPENAWEILTLLGLGALRIGVKSTVKELDELKQKGTKQ